MNPPLRRLRSAGVAVAAATVIGLVAAPAAFATDSGSDAPRLTPELLASLSDRYTPQSDGTPGLVAELSDDDDDAAAAPQLKSSLQSENDEHVSGFASKGSIETMRGAATPIALDGTDDWIAITSAGSLARYDGKGALKWQTGVHDLHAAWQVEFQSPFTPEDLTPVLYQGFNPYQPGATGRHPFAELDATGDGVADIAVAYQLGVAPLAPFDTPGSELTSGTFISVIDGADGHVAWHTIVPGTVGSMIAQDGLLIAAENTGPDYYNNPVAEQADSRSALVAYRFSAGGGTVAGEEAWTYSTGAPFADWSDIESLGAGRITAGWTDTPLGLGDPRPAAGHVLVVDTADGSVDLDVKTPGYPRIVQKDAVDGRVLVAEQNDPYDAVRLDLTSIDIATGERSVIASHDGAIPVALSVNTNGSGPRYLLAEVTINADLSDGPSVVRGVAANGSTAWTYTTASTIGAPIAPVTGLTVDASGTAVATVGDGIVQSLTQPEGPLHTQLVALDTRTGKVSWTREGAVTGNRATPYQGGFLTVGYDLTAYHTDKKGSAKAMPLLGDLYAAGDYDVNGDGRNDVIAGGQSHGVFALDGAALAEGRTVVLWSQAVSQGVHGVQIAAVKDKKGKASDRVVVATSHGFAVIDPRSGKLKADVDTGAFQWDATIADGRILASGDKAFGAYDADGGVVWSYRPAGAGDKQVAYSSPAVRDGQVFLEYGGFRARIGIGASDPAPTAVALDLASGVEQWAVAASGGTKTSWIEAQDGVYAADVPGADGHAVAFAFGGDSVVSRAHQVMVLDGRTGAAVTSYDGPGSATFQGFASSADQGLFWLHTNQIHQAPADGSTPYFMRTMANVWTAQTATAQDGSEVFVGGVGGILSWTVPFPNQPNDYITSVGSAFAYFAASVTPAELNEGDATDLIALPRDYAAYNLNQQVGGFGNESYATDKFPHGVTILQATGASPATGTDAAAPAPTTAEVKAATAAEVPDGALPLGYTGAPHELLTQQAVTPDATAVSVPGYTPQQIQKRLGLTGDGEGQTVAITIAYHYATAEADVNAYSQQFGLPQTCGTAAEGEDCFDFDVVFADGTQPEVNSGWNQEAALDIQAVHAVVPKAKVVLVEATDPSAAALYRAIDVAAALKPTAINNSWGMPEFSEESFYDGHCALSTSTCVQSTGDSGWPVSYGSANPHILSVGGTNLVLDAEGDTVSESTWTRAGGGFSFFEQRPAYQDGVVSSSLRGTPDVSFVADPNTGFAIFYTVGTRQYWAEIGGTSLSSPLWAGILAATDQLRSADGKDRLVAVDGESAPLHEALYGLTSGLADVTAGSNGLCGAECTAGAGYDTATGLGSPVAGIDVALAAR